MRVGGPLPARVVGVITGGVGAGKTVALRAALAGLGDASRHTVIYLSNPAVGGRGRYSGIVTTLGGVPRFHKSALIPQTMDLLAAEEHERGRTVTLVLDEALRYAMTGMTREETTSITTWTSSAAATPCSATTRWP